MATELRKTGISPVGDVPWGTHFCHFYETKQDLLDTLIPYFKAGLESKEFCVWVVSTPELITVEEAKGALAQAVPDIDRHLSDDNIEILNGLDWYLTENVFSLERVTSAWDAKLDRALALGYDGMRISGDTLWLAEKDWKDFCAYEKQLNDSIADRPMTVLCTYPLAKSRAAEVLDVVETHQFAIARRQGEWKVIETPELIQAKAEIKRLNQKLEQRVIERTSELHASEERFRQVAENIREVFWLSTADLSNVLYISPAYEAVWGRSRESLYREPRSFIAAIHPEDRPRAVAAIERDREQGFEVEYRVVRSDESIRWIRARGFPIQDESGRFYRVAGIAEDITERKQAEEKLKQSEERFRRLVELMPVAVYVCDTSGTIQSYNNRAVELWGREPKSRDTAQRYCGSLRLYSPDGKFVPHEESKMAEVLRTGIEARDLEVVIERPDGSYITVLVNIAPLRNGDGELIGAMNCFQDITERKQAEEKLKRSESQLAEAQRVAHVGYWERNIDTDEITWSDETYRIFGLQPQEPIENFQEFIHPEDRPVQLEATARVLRGEHYDVEYRVIRPTGEVRLVHSQGDAIQDESGRPRRAFGTVQDVTELKRAEEKLKATSEQLRALSARLQSAREEEGARIARELHDELGSALTTLKWDLVRVEKLSSESASRPDLAKLRSKTKDMMSLIDSTINTVRRIASELRPSLLDDLGLLAAIEWQAQQFEARTGIICQIDTLVQTVDLRREQATAIFRILQEAMTNVLRHAHATRVNITVAEEAGEVVLEIRDNGRGITEDESAASGSLGLMGMRERAHLVGGGIEINGVARNGTVLTLRVPIRDETSD